MFYATFQFNAGLTLLFTVMALLPLGIFMYLMPWTMTTVAILSSLGTNLNRNWVNYIHDNPSGGGGAHTEEGHAAKPMTVKARMEAAAAEEGAMRPTIEDSVVHIDDRAMMRLARSGNDVEL
eukprot:GFYU01080417.1.p1 GENE.GFYU01080417.1~~GFYU01080417.1.p1  ORF type:complete len:134 (-),score=9.62 GFYU01080417.1:33-398(-)